MRQTNHPTPTRGTLFRQKVWMLILLNLSLASPWTFVFAEAEEESSQENRHDSVNRELAERILARVKPGQTMVEGGCMTIPVDWVRAIAEGRKSGFGSSALLWPDGIVYYTFNPPGIEDGTIDSKGNTAMGRKEQIRAALDVWESVAKLTFIEVPFGNEGVDNYIEFNDHPSLNNSIVGMSPFPVKQTLNITSWGFQRVILHEVGHALGLVHEQSRDDRDAFVDILTENIQEGKEHNFLVNMTENPGDYDFDSIMHYRHNAFGIDGKTTIDPLPPNESKKFTMGTVQELSDLDKAGMAAMYGELTPTSAPGALPTPGNYDEPIQFSLVINPAIDAGETRYFYTLDGSEPTTQSNEYFPGDVIPINSNTTVKYFAIRKQHSPSVVVSIPYTFTNPTPMVETPVFSPNGGTWGPPRTVTIFTDTPGAEIHYSFGATLPSLNSPLYTAPFDLTQSTRLNARAFKEGYTPSEVASAEFIIQAIQLPPPTIYPDPNSQEFPGQVEVFLSSTVLGARIRYTLDGTEPNDTDSSIFTSDPFPLTQTTTVKAKVFLDGYTPSETVTAVYTVIPSAPAPVINPNGGSYSGSVNVSFSVPSKSRNKAASVPGDFIYYTANGDDPETYSNHYDGAITLGIGNYTIKARTIYPGLPPSTITTAQFTVYDPSPTLDPPDFLPRARDHANSVTVTIESFTEGAEIRYTIGDNVAPPDPTPSDNLYTSPFTLGLPTAGGNFWFIRAKVFKGVEASTLIQKTYQVFSPLGTVNAPVFDPTPERVFDNPVVVNLTATTDPPTIGVRTYVTTNGDTPEVPDPPEAGVTSVTLDGSGILKAIAWRDFFGQSQIASASYQFKCATPTITALGEKSINHIGSVTVIMDSTTTGGSTKIRYATGGLEPDANSTVYAGPITFGVGTHVIKAKVFRNGYDDSDTAVATFIVSETPEIPSFLIQPVTQTVDQYVDVTFVAEATGVPDPTYQWYFNGAPLAGETFSTLLIPRVQPAHAGSYYVIAANDAGETTSEFATLAVNVAETPTPTPTSTEVETLTPTPTATASETYTPTPTSTDSETYTPTPTVPAGVQHVILSASQDNTLIERNDGSVSNGAGPHFNAGRVSSNGSFTLRRGILAFDILSQMPPGSTIQAVTLTLNMSKTQAGTMNVTLHKTLADWGEGTSTATGGNGAPSTPGDATWIHRFFDTVAWANPGGDFERIASATASVGGIGPYVWSSAQMAADVQSWLDDPGSNFGWIVVGEESLPTTRTVKQFDSRENSTASNHPALEVSFVPPEPEPTSTASPTPTESQSTEIPTETPTSEIVPTNTSTPRFTPKPVTFEDADINEDGFVDTLDLLDLLRFWKQTP